MKIIRKILESVRHNCKYVFNKIKYNFGISNGAEHIKDNITETVKNKANEFKISWGIGNLTDDMANITVDAVNDAGELMGKVIDFSDL